VEPTDSPRRSEALRNAESAFNAIINGGATGTSLHQSYLGLGIVLRETKRYQEAERQFKNAMPESVEAQVGAQVRYEWGRTLAMAGRFEDARTMLRPLAERDPDKLGEAERGLLFYVNLAKLWEANSYLLEAEALRREAAPSAAQRSAAQQTRDAGLTKLLALCERGGPWPRVAALYATASADPKFDAGQRSALDLYFLARKLADEKRWPEARDKLRAALERPGLAADMQALLLFDLGWALYEGKELRPAAEAFARVARDHKRHARAPQAAQYAYQLYGRVADESKAREDYQLLADVVLNLVQSYPDHPQRVEAMWLLPLALQGAGRFGDAADQYAKVPKESPRFEEAQYRRTVCLRRAYDAEKSNLSAEQRVVRGRAAAMQMTQYAQQAAARASGADSDAVRKWSAEALVGAAELLLSEGVNQYAEALELLKDFEQRYRGSPSLGRALAARIRAYRGLRQMDAATRTVQEFLAAAPAEQSGPVLLSVTQGIEDELDRLRTEQRDEELRKLATDALPLFERLDAWCNEDPARGANAPAVGFGLARLYYTAGRYEQAAERVEKLLAADPRNGNLRRLQAQILTAGLAADERGAKLESAKRAWAELLKDTGLRTQAPERYWEARYNYLRLLLLEGHAAQVDEAIRQERIWYPDLGGPAWAQRFDALAKAAAERRKGE
jgi:tetratricopeptide (TPR) repeat protein